MTGVAMGAGRCNHRHLGPAFVTAELVSAVISGRTGIPVGKLRATTSTRLLGSLNMARSSYLFLLAISLATVGCSTPGADSAESDAVESVFTPLDRASCEQKVDLSDPNETPYLLCPGVGGYSLIVRAAGSGRTSVDIVNASQEIHPLDYDVFVTPHMSNLADRAEWRVATADGQQTPVALVVPVEAREDLNDPETVTNTYLAVAKIATIEVCVTDRVVEERLTAQQIHGIADSARKRACAPPQPPISADGRDLP